RRARGPEVRADERVVAERDDRGTERRAESRPDVREREKDGDDGGESAEADGEAVRSVEEHEADERDRALLGEDARGGRDREAREPGDGTPPRAARAPHGEKEPGQRRERREQIGASDDVGHRL